MLRTVGLGELIVHLRSRCAALCGDCFFTADVSACGRLQVALPLQNAGTRRCGFGLRNVSSLLQRDGQGGVGQRIVWRQCSESKCSRNGLLQPARIAKCTNKPVVRLKEVWDRR